MEGGSQGGSAAHAGLGKSACHARCAPRGKGTRMRSVPGCAASERGAHGCAQWSAIPICGTRARDWVWRAAGGRNRGGLRSRTSVRGGAGWGTKARFEQRGERGETVPSRGDARRQDRVRIDRAGVSRAGSGACGFSRPAQSASTWRTAGLFEEIRAHTRWPIM